MTRFHCLSSCSNSLAYKNHYTTSSRPSPKLKARSKSTSMATVTPTSSLSCKLPKLAPTASIKSAPGSSRKALNFELLGTKRVLQPVRISSPGLKHGVISKVSASTNSVIGLENQTYNSENENAKNKVLPFRIGHGFDLHRMEPNLPLIIGGINIPHDRGCEAHSDGDVLLHCVVDAILGALGLPDIGQIFPDNDPKWKGAASSVFVEEAVKLMHEAGYEIGNLDATLILQRPKLSPHKGTIQANLCALLGVSSSVVNIKAKTHEKVDSLGENRSIAAHTVVLLMKK